MSNYFPFGFQYPTGFKFNDTNPDPGIEAVRKRIAFLNTCHDAAYTPDGNPMPGHIFAAAMDLFQHGSNLDVDAFWDLAQANLDVAEIGQIATALYPKVQDTLPLLDFPNAIALFDCRFVSVKEWEHIRRYSIGGSEAGTVLGVSHFQSPRSLYHEKKSPCPDDHDAGTQQIFDYGHAIEDYTIAYVAEMLGAKRYPEFRMFAHKDYPFITCNPDGILIFPDGHFALFEAKSATRWKLDDWRVKIPDYYVPQPRQYLEVLNDPRFTEGYIGCCFGGLPSDMKVHKFVRDKAAGAEQVQKIVAYWETYIQPGVLPAFCGDPELDMEAAYKYQKKENPTGTDPLPAACVDKFELYFDLQSQLKALNADIKTAKTTEDAYMAEIRPCAADGITTCSLPGGMTYKIKVSSYDRETVDEQALPDKVRYWLLERAAGLHEVSVGFYVPKISKAIKKAPKTTTKRKTA